MLDNQASEFVIATTGINFGKISSDTNGKGVYTFSSTKDDEYPVHYYRGDVKDNNVKFAGFCWKIVRTTSTGGVKLIYNGSPDVSGGCTTTTGEVTQIGVSAFNNRSNSIESAGYMVDNKNDSAIKKVIDTWYQSNMTSYTKKLEDAVWCNDRSSRVDGDYTYFGANDRVYTTHQPSLACINDDDKFTVNAKNGNGLLTYPVALLTVDEIMLAGGSAINSSFYLYMNQDWWLLSPRYFIDKNVDGFILSSGGGNLFISLVSNSNGVRPSVSLAPSTKIKSGDGTMNHPFEV